MTSAIGVVTTVGPGIAVYSKHRKRTTSTGTVPVGGLVVAVSESLDTDTGEILRAFRCFDHVQTRPYLVWSTVAEIEVDLSTIEVVPMNTLVAAWRRLAAEIAYSGRYKERKGPATVNEIRCCQAIAELQALVFGPDGVLHAETDALVAKASEPRPSMPMHAGLVDER